MSSLMRFERIKSATVAIAKVDQTRRWNFEIIGSGVCIHPRGLILTCEHVLRAFLSDQSNDILDDAKKRGSDQHMKLPKVIIPFAIFYQVDKTGRLIALQARVDLMTGSTKQDVGLIRVLED